MELAGHASHTSDVAPTVVEYLPLPHSVQSSEPVSILYFPAKHAVQVPPSLPVKPALHLHSDCPGWELYVLAGQDKQLPTPISGLYVPIGHRVQEPADPVQPAAHMSEQSLCESLPADDVWPEGQS